MSNLRRYYSTGNIYFITCVTYRRMPILLTNSDIFMDAIASALKRNQFELVAHVIMPDHFHIIIDPQKCNLSDLLKSIKMSFASKYRIKTNTKGRIWQYRFWDHIIRNQEDFNHHLNYIHYNPVKHGITKNPFEYGNSSLPKYFKRGYYDKNWGTKGELNFEREYGE